MITVRRRARSVGCLLSRFIECLSSLRTLVCGRTSIGTAPASVLAVKIAVGSALANHSGCHWGQAQQLENAGCWADRAGSVVRISCEELEVLCDFRNSLIRPALARFVRD